MEIYFKCILQFDLIKETRCLISWQFSWNILIVMDMSWKIIFQFVWKTLSSTQTSPTHLHTPATMVITCSSAVYPCPLIDTNIWLALYEMAIRHTVVRRINNIKTRRAPALVTEHVPPGCRTAGGRGMRLNVVIVVVISPVVAGSLQCSLKFTASIVGLWNRLAILVR